MMEKGQRGLMEKKRRNRKGRIKKIDGEGEEKKRE